MAKEKSRFGLKIMTALLVGLMMATPAVYGYIACNGLGGGYCDPSSDPGCSDESSEKTGGATIESQVEEAGGSFLSSIHHIFALSNRVEMSNLNGVDLDEMQQITDNALVNIMNANAAYASLIRVQEATPYNREVIAKLNAFRYRRFRLEHGLNRVIFREVKGFLRNGDITGAFKRFHARCLRIEELMMAINNDVASGRLPELSSLWQVNEEASQALIFSQYITRVFYALKENQK